MVFNNWLYIKGAVKNRFDRTEKQMQNLWRKVIESVNSMSRGASYEERKKGRNAEIARGLERLNELERNDNNNFDFNN